MFDPVVMDIVLLFGMTVVLVYGVRRIIQMHRLVKASSVKQVELAKAGRIISWLGVVVAVGVPRLFNVRYRNDNKSTLIASLIYALGFIIIFSGWKISIAAYGTKEETPDWIKRATAFWKLLWSDNTN